MLAAEKRGLEVIMSVHDEVIIEVNYRKADEKSKLLDKIMSTSPPWALGMPLDSKGFIAKRYKK